MKHRLPLMLGLSAVAALTLSDTVVTVPAYAAEQVEVPGPTSSGTESAEVAEDLTEAFQAADESNTPAPTFYNLRFAEAVETDTTHTSRFPLPSECTPSSQELVLNCADGEVAFAPVAITAAGESVPYEVSVTGSEIVVSAEALPELDSEYVFTVFAGPAVDSEEIKTATETFSWMMSAPLVGSTLPAIAPDPPLSEDAYEDWDAGEVDSDDLDDEEFVWDEETEAQFPEPVPGSLPVAEAYGSKRPAKVKVPGHYVYCSSWETKRCQPKSLHDYCTKSPDTLTLRVSINRFAMADFRGPCARHDLAIDAIRKRAVSVTTKRSSRAAADRSFKQNLRTNCAYAFYNASVPKATCNATASVYYSEVSKRTKNWNGK